MIDPHNRGVNGWNPEFERRQAERRAVERQIRAQSERAEHVARLAYQLGLIDGRLGQHADLLDGGALSPSVAEALTLAAGHLLEDHARIRAELEALGVKFEAR